MTFDDLHYQNLPEELFVLFILYALEEAAKRTNHSILHEFIEHILKHNFIPGVFWKRPHFETIEKSDAELWDIEVMYHWLNGESGDLDRATDIIGTLESTFSVMFTDDELDDILERAVEKFTELQIFKITYLLLHRLRSASEEASENAASVQHTHDRLQDHLFDTL